MRRYHYTNSNNILSSNHFYAMLLQWCEKKIKEGEEISLPKEVNVNHWRERLKEFVEESLSSPSPPPSTLEALLPILSNGVPSSSRHSNALTIQLLSSISPSISSSPPPITFDILTLMFDYLHRNRHFANNDKKSEISKEEIAE